MYCRCRLHARLCVDSGNIDLDQDIGSEEIVAHLTRHVVLSIPPYPNVYSVGNVGTGYEPC